MAAWPNATSELGLAKAESPRTRTAVRLRKNSRALPHARPASATPTQRPQEHAIPHMQCSLPARQKPDWSTHLPAMAGTRRKTVAQLLFASRAAEYLAAAAPRAYPTTPTAARATSAPGAASYEPKAGNRPTPPKARRRQTIERASP